MSSPVFHFGILFPQGLVFDEDACTGCLSCVRACPCNAMRRPTGGIGPLHVPEACTRCFDCVRACPAGALTVGGRDAGALTGAPPSNAPGRRSPAR